MAGKPIFSAVYDALSRLEERGPMGERRSRLLSTAIGSVVEIGAGTGLNFRHYPPAVSGVDAVEPDPHMLRRARKAAAEAAVPVRLHRAPAERLPFDDAVADTAVATLVLCSVDYPDEALAELRRVLRRNGRLLFIEHVRADEERAARRQDRWERPWGWVGGGCHPNRESVRAIEQAGFEIEELERYREGLPLVRPHVMGVAVSR